MKDGRPVRISEEPVDVADQDREGEGEQHRHDERQVEDR